MKIVSAFLFLVLFRPMVAQDATAAPGQPPKDVDDALRSRVAQFYDATVAGKFNEAYTMVAPESQNQFFSSDKVQYLECHLSKIEYSDNFSKALVTHDCKTEWRWQGHVSPSVMHVESHWKQVDKLWYWVYVKPTFVRSPFSPSGIVPLPPDESAADSHAVAIPKNMRAAALNILNKVNLDKTAVSLRADTSSKDELHVRNDMPGEVNLVVAPSPVSGLRVKASKTVLKANETAAVTFEYAPDEKGITCSDCAARISHAWVQLTIEPTGQVFQIGVNFTNQKSEQFPLPK